MVWLLTAIWTYAIAARRRRRARSRRLAQATPAPAILAKAQPGAETAQAGTKPTTQANMAPTAQAGAVSVTAASVEGAAEAPRAMEMEGAMEMEASEPALAQEETTEPAEALLQPANRLDESTSPEDFEEPEPRVSRRLMRPRRMGDQRSG